MNIIQHYFPNLSQTQLEQFAKLKELYDFWNNQINLISRKDMDNFYEKHVLHSLGIASCIQFKPGTKILDVGTGGGFPGVPLSIMFPEVDFLLVDSIGKKIKVVQEVSQAIGLKNVRAQHERAEKVKEKFDFIVSRAVARMAEFYPWVKNAVLYTNNNDLENGILYLKGGDLKEELAELKMTYNLIPLQTFFKEEFFETKCVVHIPML